DVFTDIDISVEYFQDILKKQAVVNSGVKFKLIDEESSQVFEYFYANGIVDYVEEINQDKGFSKVQFFETITKGRDRNDKDEYKVKLNIAFCFNNEINLLEYYHN